MELYFAATGVKHELEYFEKQMQFQHFLLPFKDKDGKEWKQPIYGILAPMNLYRFVFPKEYLNEVIKMLEFDDEGVAQNYKKYDKRALIMRKILKAKPLPKEIPKNTKMRLFKRGNVGLIPIGFREDEPNYKDPNGTTHEGI